MFTIKTPLNPQGFNPQRGTLPKQISTDSDEFKDILERLDKCSTFLDSHSYYHDYVEYSTKFRQVHIRALSLIKNYVVEYSYKLQLIQLCLV